MNRSVSRFIARRWHAILDNPDLSVRQAPTAVMTVLAVLLCLAVPELAFGSVWMAVAGAALVVAATGFAGVLTWRGIESGWYVIFIPVVDILGLGLFRAGTGGAMSLFSAIILLPVIWIASLRGTRYVLVVLVLTAAALLTPYLIQPPDAWTAWLRGVIAPVVYAVVAAIVNELSRLGRVRADTAERLAVERSAALAENLEIVGQLRESEARYEELLSTYRSVWGATTAQAVVGTDGDGLILAWNPGAEILFGRTEDEVAGQVQVGDFFPDDVLAALAEDAAEEDAQGTTPPGLRALFREADAGTPVERSIELRTSAGDLVPARLTVTARKGEGGGPVGYLLVMTDETRAAEVARMKDEFVGMISHELRTPLSSILGYIELLQDDTAHPLTAEQLQFLAIVERNARRLLKLVGDLLFTAQVESGRFPLDLQETDLRDIAAASAESAEPVAAASGVTLVTELPETAVNSRVDALRIGQAIDNLISNALKFTPHGGKVAVRVEADGDSNALVAVRDSGVGIPKDELGKLFTRFFRASTATQNAVPGVGLGLNITKAIVTAHGGRMEVSSEVGVGTEFRIILPRRSATSV